MEFRCPECAKRLRIPDGRANPTVRCGNCGHVFRPLAAAGRAASTPQEPAQTSPPELQPNQDVITRESDSSSARRFSGGGLGVGFFILLLLLTRGPRLVKQFFDRPKEEEVPVRLDDQELRALQEALERADQQGETWEHEGDPDIRFDQFDKNQPEEFEDLKPVPETSDDPDR